MRTFLISALLSVSAGTTWADSLTFTGFSHGSETVTIGLSSPLTPISETVYAGGFSTLLGVGNTFESYCVDVYQSIDLGKSYGDYTPASSTHVFANNAAPVDLGKLFAVAGPVTTATQEAAFQIAVWEIAYETQGPYDLANGSATFVGGTADTSGALTLASSWLAGLTHASAAYSIGILDSPLHQDVIFAPIPEPSTLALMGIGLLGLIFMARRRSTANGMAS